MADSPEEPVRGPRAFAEESDAASMSRAAVLLGISAQLDRPREPRLLFLRESAGGRVSPEDEFEIPPVQRTGERFRFVEPLAIRRIEGDERLRAANRAELASEVFQSPEPVRAARLAAYCLDDPDPLTRVAAAVLDFRLSVDPRRAIDTLAEGTRSGDELVRDVAATGLAKISPRHPALVPLRRRRDDRRGPAEEPRTSMLIHGTWAAGNSWWQPGGDFHTYLRGGYRPDLYAEVDRFDWTGGYSPGARADAAVELDRWLRDHDEEGIRLITHSHGGNVAFLASGSAPFLGDLIVLSCPVRDEYVPYFPNIGRVISVRVKLDLVILVDGGAQSFDYAQIDEKVLPLWFNHSATHEPDVWEKHGVASLIES
jgi:hypothetical protein